jgi:hypothetical protein
MLVYAQRIASYLFSVASRTTRKAFWLLSSGLHLCALNAVTISATASASVANSSELNSEPHRSHTPARIGFFFTMRSPRFGISQVYRSERQNWKPVDFKRHHYQAFETLAKKPTMIYLSSLQMIPGGPFPRKGVTQCRKT